MRHVFACVRACSTGDSNRLKFIAICNGPRLTPIILHADKLAKIVMFAHRERAFRVFFRGMLAVASEVCVTRRSEAANANAMFRNEYLVSTI